MKRHQRLSKPEMCGFIVLAFVLLAIALAYNYKKRIFPENHHSQLLTQEEVRELEGFSKQIRDNNISKANKTHAMSQPVLRPFKFDPNTADSLTLGRLGLKTWQVANILKYREHGGKWKKPEDFARLYGLSNAEYETLRPFIHIEKTDSERAKDKERTRQDSIRQRFPTKFKEGTILSLNEADTTLLKGIPGIGSYYAQKICRYRERLGGFISTAQLKEIEGLPLDIEKWFTVTNTSQIKKTAINKASFKELVRHPYLNYEQVKVIYNYIQKYGKIQCWEDLSNSEHFDSTDFVRLRPYSDFR